MPTSKPRITITVTTELLSRIEAYQTATGAKNQTQAILSLLRQGFDAAGIPAVEPSTDLTADALSLARRYDALDARGQGAVRALLDYEKTAPSRTEPQRTQTIYGFDRSIIPEEEQVSFPIVGAIAAGYDREPIYDYTGDVQVYPKSFLRGRPQDEYFVLRVSGHSMEPEFHDGDSVLVLKTGTVEQGAVAVVGLGSGENATLKKVRFEEHEWLELIPLNPDYPVRRIEGTELSGLCIWGRAAALGREL
ncbi:MAG: S24 family peptidase [Oscillospiraceae bacterium]|nr:S24 family peptidase [Oscillospiraceae bacterium]